MITELLPPAVATFEAFVDPPGVTLFPEEQQVIATAVERRRREFSTGRACARAALAKLGVPPVAILPGPRGAPTWPPGVVGSITHCAGYRAAAVADNRKVTTLGVDAEPNEPLPSKVLDVVACEVERAAVGRLAREYPHVCWDRLLFSAKESVYKAWFPLTHRWLDFLEAEVILDPNGRAFSARLLAPGHTLDGGQLNRFQGRWLARDGLVATAIAVGTTPTTSTRTGDLG